uniref:AB hydrolase-1 domain-containing protein n=1 Tax=Stomoxys calcitrans TaxID=35570 RepID=A0A1I8P236_STOCA
MMQSAALKIVPQLNMLGNTVIRQLSMHAERQVKVNDVNINVMECGSGPKSILLMPGVLGSIWTDFAPQIQQLPKLLPNHRIIAWDPPGYGKSVEQSRRWHLYSLDDDARFAVDLMKALNINKFSLLAWSAGAISGMIAASRHQENIEKLIMWGGAAYLTTSEINFYKNSRDVSKWPTQMRTTMEIVYGADKFPQLWNDMVDYICALETERDGDFCKNCLDNINAPIFLLHGKVDPLKDPVHVPYLKERLKISRYHEFPEGKHNIHLRYPDEFNRLVADFLLDQSEKS